MFKCSFMLFQNKTPLKKTLWLSRLKASTYSFSDPATDPAAGTLRLANGIAIKTVTGVSKDVSLMSSFGSVQAAISAACLGFPVYCFCVGCPDLRQLTAC